MHEQGMGDEPDLRLLSEARFETTCVGYKLTEPWEQDQDEPSRELARRTASSQIVAVRPQHS